MNPPTRSPGARQPSAFASVRRLKTNHLSAHAELSSADAEESGLRGVPPACWVLEGAVLAVRTPSDPSDRGGWLSNLRAEGISVLVSLDAEVPVSRAVLARHHMHAVACTLRQPAGELTVDTALALCGGLLRLLRQGERIALCCDSDASRTALVVSALLLWMGRPLEDAVATFPRLGALPVSSAVRDFLFEFQDALAHRELVGPSWNRRYAL